jgi:uncharacterized protein
MAEENQTPQKTSSTRNRGFASMDPELQRRIASQGGKAAHQQGTAHEFDSEEARAAGRKGGEVVSQNRQHMAEIGRKGGEASGGRKQKRKLQTESQSQPQAEM